MNTQHNYMKPSSQEEAAVKGTRHATLGADDGGCRAHTTCGGCECVGNHSATGTPAGPGAQDWEHWEWTGGDMRLALTMQQRRWNDTHAGYHKDMDYERGAEMVAAAYTPDDTTAGRWVLAGLWVVRNPTPDSVQQFIGRWLDDGIQLASSVMRSRYDYPVFFDRILLSWDDTVKAIGHAIQGEGWRVDWEWDFNRGADGRVVLTNTKDKSAPALVFIDPARCQQTDAGAGTGSVDNRINNDTTNAVAARQAGVRSDAVGVAESAGVDGGVLTAGPRATINDGATRADGVSPCSGINSTGGGVTANTPGGEQARDKETPCQSASQLDNAAHCSSCGVAASGVDVPTTRFPDEDAYTLTRRGDTETTGLAHAGTASVHGDAVVAPGDEKAGMFNDKQTQREKSFAGEGGVGAELGFIGARPHECHAGDLFNADAGVTVSDERHNSGTCATGVAGAVRGHTPAQEPTPVAPGTHGGGGSDDGPVGVSYGVPDSGFSPIVYVDYYNHQEQDWFEVYGPDHTDDKGGLLPEVAAAARHSIPAGGGVVTVSPGSFLQVIDVVKWWLGVDGNISTDALGTLRNAMKGSPR